jgi:hypothetical protein
VRVGPNGRYVLEVGADGLVVCPICGDRVRLDVASRHTGSVPSGAIVPMGWGLSAAEDAALDRPERRWWP